jgi:hypothetical protein
MPVRCLTIVVYGETGEDWHFEKAFIQAGMRSSLQSIDWISFVIRGCGCLCGKVTDRQLEPFD